VNAMHFSLLLG